MTEPVPVHRVIPGSHERPSGPECVCGAVWDGKCTRPPVEPVPDLSDIPEASPEAIIGRAQSSAETLLSAGFTGIIASARITALVAYTRELEATVAGMGAVIGEALEWFGPDGWCDPQFITEVSKCLSRGLADSGPVSHEGKAAWVIEADVYRTDDGHDPLPRLIGPFPSQDAANTHMALQGPIWGEWNLAPLTAPRTEAEYRATGGKTE